MKMRAAKTARKSRARPMPPDFPAFARLKSAELCERYHCNKCVITRWRKECGIKYDGATPAPEDFREVAPLHTHNELRKIYGRSGSVIVRWAQEAGVTLKRIRQSYVKRDAAEEIALCLTCPFSQCHPASCARIRR